MTQNQNSNRSISPRPGGVFSDVTNRIRLIGRLMMDERVNPVVKLLPIGALIYTIVPLDLLPVNPVDDAFLIWLGTNLFVDLCPPEVVNEHMLSIKGLTAGTWKEPGYVPQQEEIVEGEYSESDPNANRRSTPR